MGAVFPSEEKQRRQSEKDTQQLKGFSFKWKQTNQANLEDTGPFSMSVPHFFFSCRENEPL